MLEDGEVIRYIAKVFPSIVGGIVAIPVGGIFGPIIGLVINTLSQDLLEPLISKLPGLNIQDFKLGDKFYEVFEESIKEAVEGVKSDIKRHENLPQEAKDWLLKRLDEMANPQNWGELRLPDSEFESPEDLFKTPIIEFLKKENPPEGITPEIIERVSRNVAYKWINSYKEILTHSKDAGYTVFDTTMKIYKELFASAGMENKWKRMEQELEKYNEAIIDWTVKQIAILTENFIKRFEKIEFRLDDIKKRLNKVEVKVEEHDEKLEEHEVRILAVEKAQKSFIPPPQLKLGARVTPFYDVSNAVIREELMRNLELILNGEKSIAVVGLHGMGGVGKSFLVNMFIHEKEKTIKKRFPDGVVWVEVNSQSRSVESIASEALSHFYTSLHGISDTVSELKRLLIRHKILLIFDGVEAMKPDELKKLMFNPVDSRLIFTTRDKTPFGHGISILDVDVMTPDEAIEMFSKYLGKKTVQSQLGDFKKLADALGRLPLAISIVAARMRNKSWSARDALDRFNALKLEFLKSGRAETKDGNIELSFKMSFDMLEESEKNVIYALSVFSEKGAKEEILAKVMGIDSNDYKALDDMTRILEALIDLALVRPPKDGYYSMHNLIRLYTRKEAEKAGKLRGYQEQFVDTMLYEAHKWQRETERTKEEGFSAEKYNLALKFAFDELPNIIEAFNAAIGLEKYQKAVDLAIYSGSLLEDAALYDDEIMLLESAKEIAESKSSIEDGDTATTYNNLGLAYHSKGNYDKAIEFYEKALEIRFKVLGEEHPDTATTYNNLGLAYHSKAEYDKAIKYYQNALNIDLKVLGKEHPDIAINYNNIGGLYHSKGENDKALEYYEKALDIDLKLFGNEHPHVARDYNNIGSVYYSRSDYDKAIKYYGKALNIRLNVLGEEHPDTATTYNNLGVIFYLKGEFERAIYYFKKALHILERRFDECHPNRRKTLLSLIEAYKRKGGL